MFIQNKTELHKFDIFVIEWIDFFLLITHMMKSEENKRNKKKYIAINLILFAFLYLSVSFNKEYIRPEYGNTPFWGIITGSYSNFIAVYIISLFSLTPIFANRISLKRARIIFYTISVIAFIILTIEEIKPFVDASKTYDIYDIIASGLGSVFAVLSFEIFFSRKLKQ